MSLVFLIILAYVIIVLSCGGFKLTRCFGWNNIEKSIHLLNRTIYQKLFHIGFLHKMLGALNQIQYCSINRHHLTDLLLYANLNINLGRGIEVLEFVLESIPLLSLSCSLSKPPFHILEWAPSINQNSFFHRDAGTGFIPFTTSLRSSRTHSTLYPTVSYIKHTYTR